MLTVTTRMRAGRWIGVTALFGALSAVLALGSIAVPNVAASASATSQDTNSTEIDRILADTNSARAAEGLAALQHNTAIDAVAQAWAEKLASDSFAHNPNYSAQIPAGWSLASENIAGGYSAATVVAGWLDSPGHRANIMSSATDIGIGFFVAPNGTAYAVQNFARYPQSVTTPTTIASVAAVSAASVASAVSAGPAGLSVSVTPTATGSTFLGRTLTANAGT